jgi:hypothetical protein
MHTLKPRYSSGKQRVREGQVLSLRHGSEPQPSMGMQAPRTQEKHPGHSSSVAQSVQPARRVHSRLTEHSSHGSHSRSLVHVVQPATCTQVLSTSQRAHGPHSSSVAQTVQLTLSRQ